MTDKVIKAYHITDCFNNDSHATIAMLVSDPCEGDCWHVALWVDPDCEFSAEQFTEAYLENDRYICIELALPQ